MNARIIAYKPIILRFEARPKERKCTIRDCRVQDLQVYESITHELAVKNWEGYINQWEAHLK